MLEPAWRLVIIQAFAFLYSKESAALGVTLLVIGEVGNMVPRAIGCTTATSDVVQTHIRNRDKIMRWEAVLEVPWSIDSIGEVEATAVVD
jgi:lipoprotein signal peptidase